MNLSEINKEIGRLNVLRRELRQQEIERQKECARKFVGKCYRQTDGPVLKIVGIPQTRLTMTDTIYEANYFPAVFLNYPNKISETCIHNDELSLFEPCYCDTVLFYQWDDNRDKRLYDGLTEISQEEFDREFDKCIKNFKGLMNNESYASC
jgi:hypothetical protein